MTVAPERWHLDYLVAEMMLNTTVLVWWRYRKYSLHKVILAEWHHFTQYSIIQVISNMARNDDNDRVSNSSVDVKAIFQY